MWYVYIREVEIIIFFKCGSNGVRIKVGFLNCIWDSKIILKLDIYVY